MTTTFDKIVIEALNSKERYPDRLIKITDIFDKLKVLEIATGKTPLPGPPIKEWGESQDAFDKRTETESTAILDWDQKDRKALRAIRFRLSNDLVKQFAPAKTPKNLGPLLPHTSSHTAPWDRS
ncbi:hypothetical protein PQX77_016064 [Marasmius sp. AFHP31]|nr:hypothetical protein PQX77_016064 [Marasmius sp. AFHP31]